MSEQTVIEVIARAFHAAYERHAVEAGWSTHPECQTRWHELPKANQETMRQTVAQLLRLGIIRAGDYASPERYEDHVG